MPDRSPLQRAVIGGRPCVVHGLRAAQPGEGEALTSPQPGQRWATGGRPDVDLSGARLCLCVARLNALRSSRRRDTLRRDRGTRPLRPRHVRKTAATCSRSHRRHGACMHCAPRSLAPSSLRAARTAPATTGRPWPSPLHTSLRSNTLGIVPRACVRRLRPRTSACHAGVQRVRCGCTPCTPAATLIVCVPHPRIARIVRAPTHRCRARSRGFGRAVDITRCYAHTSCVSGAARGVHRVKSRARTTRRYVNCPPAHSCACCRCRASLHGIASASCTHCAALRASARHPWLALHRTRSLNRCAVRADREHALRLREGSNSGQHEEANRHRSQREVRGVLLVVVVAA